MKHKRTHHHDPTRTPVPRSGAGTVDSATQYTAEEVREVKAVAAKTAKSEITGDHGRSPISDSAQAQARSLFRSPAHLPTCGS